MTPPSLAGGWYSRALGLLRRGRQAGWELSFKVNRENSPNIAARRGKSKMERKKERKRGRKEENILSTASGKLSFLSPHLSAGMSNPGSAMKQSK